MFLCLQRCRCCDLPFVYEPHRASVRAGASLLLAAEVGALAHRRGRRRAGVGYARSTGSDREDAERETHDYNSTFGGTQFRAIVVDCHDALGRSHCWLSYGCGEPLSVFSTADAGGRCRRSDPSARSSDRYNDINGLDGFSRRRIDHMDDGSVASSFRSSRAVER